MSYCRFSSDNFMSDVYVYEDVSGGWTTHVAANCKLIPPIPDIIGGSFSMRVHKWLGCKFDDSARKVVYPSRMRAMIGKAWYSFTAFWHNKIHCGSLRLIPSRNIGLPHDGGYFNDETPAECAETLKMLRGLGYRVPQYAIDALESDERGDNEK